MSNLLDPRLQTHEGQMTHYAEVKLRLRARVPDRAPLLLVQSEPVQKPVAPTCGEREILARVPSIMSVPGYKVSAQELKERMLANLSVEDRKILAAYRETGPKQVKAIRLIVTEVSAAYEITPAQLWSDQRQKLLCMARMEAYYRMKHETKLSYPAMGRRAGDRDHTTILHGVRKITRMLVDGWRMRTLPDVIGHSGTGYISQIEAAPEEAMA